MAKSQFTFSTTPTLSRRRSYFDLSHSEKTSMSLGTLYPILVQEVLPGDTYKLNTSQVCRLSTAFLRPVMDNCFMDVYYFFVPNRLTYNRWENVMGQNDQSAWAPSETVTVPVVGTNAPIVSKSVGDYLGLPVGVNVKGANVLPFRAFALIYNQWFRNENVIDPMNVSVGELGASEVPNSSAWAPNNYFGMLPKVGKKKDYFTSALPSPQKGPAVEINVAGGYAPVYSRALHQVPLDFSDSNLNAGGVEFVQRNSPFLSTGQLNLYANVIENQTYPVTDSSGNSAVRPAIELTGYPQTNTNTPFNDLIPINLWASLNSSALGTSVNDLRFAFQLQKMYERDARGGTRYNEYLYSAFGVSNPDARLQIPEYIGGARMPINIQQVAQTNTQVESSAGDVESPLASLGAFSHSVGRSRFSKSFTEHGFLIGVACIRQVHTYQQGIERFWFRNKRTDYYDPLFANLGEQPIYQAELYRPASSTDDIHDSAVFGFNEAWADYRYKPNKVTGEMRSVASNSLDIWHFADEYSNAPVLSQQFIEETPEYFNRTVAVPSSSQDNFIVDFYFNIQRYAVMPTYSIPGLIDHH